MAKVVIRERLGIFGCQRKHLREKKWNSNTWSSDYTGDWNGQALVAERTATCPQIQIWSQGLFPDTPHTCPLPWLTGQAHVAKENVPPTIRSFQGAISMRKGLGKADRRPSTGENTAVSFPAPRTGICSGHTWSCILVLCPPERHSQDTGDEHKDCCMHLTLSVCQAVFGVLYKY